MRSKNKQTKTFNRLLVQSDTFLLFSPVVIKLRATQTPGFYGDYKLKMGLCSGFKQFAISLIAIL